MTGWVALTDNSWFRFLRSQGTLDEVNFWQPSGSRGFGAISVGEPLFFKLKSPYSVIGGFGVFAGFSRLPLWMAWDSFGLKNGCSSEAALSDLIGRYRGIDPVQARKTDIGCLMVVEPVFFDEADWIEQPRDMARSIQKGKRYDLSVGEGARILKECRERVALQSARIPGGAQVVREDAPRYGQSQLVRPRLGQGTFRVAVTDAYGRACAVTREHSLPALDAAHIRPFADGGPHEVSNGLALRADLHRLFDRGYVTITPDYRFKVSPRLREEFENGRIYYELEERQTLIRLPANPAHHPRAELLEHHRDLIYVG